MRLVSVPLETEKRIKLNVGFNVLGFNIQQNMFFVEVDERKPQREYILLYFYDGDDLPTNENKFFVGIGNETVIYLVDSEYWGNL